MFNISNEFVRILYLFRQIPNLDPNYPTLPYAKRYFPLSRVKTMCRSIVEPYLRYRCTVWGCCTETDLKRLQILQNRAARIVTNSAYDAQSLPLIKRLGWLSVKDLIRFETATTAFQSVNQLCPDYMAQMFQRHREQAKGR